MVVLDDLPQLGHLRVVELAELMATHHTHAANDNNDNTHVCHTTSRHSARHAAVADRNSRRERMVGCWARASEGSFHPRGQ